MSLILNVEITVQTPGDDGDTIVSLLRQDTSMNPTPGGSPEARWMGESEVAKALLLEIARETAETAALRIEQWCESVERFERESRS